MPLNWHTKWITCEYAENPIAANGVSLFRSLIFDRCGVLWSASKEIADVEVVFRFVIYCHFKQYD